MLSVNRLPSIITLGRQTEYGVKSIEFDCAEWLQQWPDLQISIWATRPGEDAEYPVNCEQTGTVIKWDIALYDTEIAGQGAVKIRGVADDKHKLSAEAGTLVIKSNTTRAGQGTAAPPWAMDVLNAASEIKDAIEQISAIGVHNADKLLYVDSNGYLQPVTLGCGLTFANGVLSVVANSSALGVAVLGQMMLGA